MLATGLLVAGLSVATAGSAEADGTTLYASPSGSGDCSAPSNACSLATALTDATSGDTIALLAGPYDGASYTISTSVTIEPAPGVSNPVVTDTAVVAVFTVDPGVTATLSGLDLTTGYNGLGIANFGTLTVEDCNIYQNLGGDGGGIENLALGTLTVENSAIYDNDAGVGGGIFNNGGLMLVQNSTIADNYSDSSGGGIGNVAQNDFGSSIIESSTIQGNWAYSGGGITNISGTTTLAATIVAEAPGGGECSGAITDDGYNVDDDGTCQLSAPGSVSGSLTIDDYLGALGSYGGPTQTVPLLPSPLPTTPFADPALGVIPGTVDLPDGSDACSGTDQRGVARQAPCDMGAFELQETDLTLSASPSSLSPGGTVTYTATVSPIPDGGTVTFTDGAGNPASLGCASKPVSAGVARCTVGYPAAGAYAVSATYSGDNDFASSMAGPITETVGTAEPTAAVVAFNPATVVYGSENGERFSVEVFGQSGDGYPKGTATVYVSGVPVCTATLTPGVFSTGSCFLTGSQLAAGTYTVSTLYNPATVSSTDSLVYYTSSTVVAVAHLTVEKDATVTTVSVSPRTVSYGSEQLAIFSVRVGSLNAKLVPNGETVTVHIGTGGVHCTASLTAGEGTCTIGGSVLGSTCVPKGGAYTFAVSATYPGDADFAASAGASTHDLAVAPPLKAPPCV